MRHHIRRGVRRDGMPWVIAKPGACDVLIRLVMPNDPDFLPFQLLAIEQEMAAHARAREAPEVTP